MLLEVSLMSSFSGYDQMEGDSGVIGSIIDELHSSDIQKDQMEGENTV